MLLKKRKFEKFTFKSVGWKLTFWHAAVFLVSIVLLASYLYYRLETKLYREGDFYLADETNEFVQFVTDHKEDLRAIEHQIQKETVAIRKYYQMYYAVVSSGGKVILESSEFTPFIHGTKPVVSSAVADAVVREYALGTAADMYHVRVVTHSIYKGEDLLYYVQVGMNLSQLEATLLDYRQILIYAIPLFFMVSLGGGYFLARRTMKPISEIMKTAKSITASNLSEKFHIRGTGDEFDELSRTFNEMIERLEEAYRKLSRFSQDVAHELRTPITALIGEVEIALAKERTNQDYKTVLLSNLEELIRLMRLTENLLLFSQDGSQLEVKEVNLNDVILDAVELFRPVAEERNVILKMDTVTQIFFVRGNKSHFEQVLSNLLDNAIRYNRPGSDVSVSLNQVDEFVELVVADRGIGIPENEQGKIFDRFYRGESSEVRSAGGTGLGLSIVRSIVEGFGGTITVASQSGVGSAFTVRFPVCHSELAAV